MAYTTVLLLTVVVLNAFYSADISCLAAECTPVNYVAFRDRIAEGVSAPAQVGHPGRFLANSYVFGCNGVITQWQAYTFNTGSHPIEFHVWREDENTANVFHLVGMNAFQNAEPDANHLISFDVPSDQQITVAPGDFAGIRTVEQVNETQDEGFRIQFDNGGTYRQYFRGGIPPNSDETLATPTTLELRLGVSGAFSSQSFGSRSPIMQAVVSASSSGAECNPVNYVAFRDRLAEDAQLLVAQVGHPGRFLANAYVFGCNGVITRWQAYTFNTGSHPIEFHVWREDETTSNVFHLVGMNAFQNVQPDANHLISFDVPSDQQITVAPGDFAGIRTVEQVNVTQDEGFRIQFDNGWTYTQYYRGGIPPNSDETLATPTILELRPFISGAFASRSLLSRSPIMRAVVSETSNTSITTTAAQTSPPTIEATPALPLSTIIAIAVSGGVLLLVIIIVVIMLLICCLLFKRNRKLTANQNQPPIARVDHGHQSYPLTNNPSYNAGNTNDNGTRLVSNQAYIHSGNPQLVDNQAYNSSLRDNTELKNNPAYNYNGNDPYYSVIHT